MLRQGAAVMLCCDEARAVRHGSRGKARQGEARRGAAGRGKAVVALQGASCQRLARYVSVWQSWRVQLSIVGFSNGLAVVASQSMLRLVRIRLSRHGLFVHGRARVVGFRYGSRVAATVGFSELS